MASDFTIEKGKCIDLSFEGKGVVKLLYGTVFVDGLFPGEEAEIKVLYKRAGSYFGKVNRLITKSPHRIQPRCGVCTACGGCQFQQLDYESQLEYKTNKVKETFRRVANLDVNVLPCIGMDEPYNYRNKVQVPLGRDPHGHLVSGFYRSGTHQIIPIDECHIEDKRASEIIKEFKTLMKEFKYEPYNEDSGRGLFRHILIRTSYHYDEIMVTFVTTVDEFKGRNNFVKALIAKCPSIKTIVQNINSRDTNVILGEKERILYGKGTIMDSILGVDFLISSKSFFQVNPVQVEKLYSKAIEYADIKDTDEVFDAYCGIGTISLIAAKKAKNVLGVEIVKEAIKDAKINAKFNNISNVSFICDDAGECLEKLNADNKKFDVVLVDPPRKGLDNKFIKSLLSVKPSRIVYVSCNPETQARDVNELLKEYKIENIQAVDMFPFTFHTESILSLKRK